MPGKEGEFGSKADCGASKTGGEAAKRSLDPLTARLAILRQKPPSPPSPKPGLR